MCKLAHFRVRYVQNRVSYDSACRLLTFCCCRFPCEFPGLRCIPHSESTTKESGLIDRTSYVRAYHGSRKDAVGWGGGGGGGDDIEKLKPTFLLLLPYQLYSMILYTNHESCSCPHMIQYISTYCTVPSPSRCHTSYSSIQSQIALQTPRRVGELPLAACGVQLEHHIPLRADGFWLEIRYHADEIKK